MISAIASLAADELSDGQFNGYAALLTASGVVMLILAATGLGRASAGERIINALFGIAFLGYGLYLLLIFDGGTVWIFFYVFIVPLVLIFQALRRVFARQRT